jgi:hypothetical protein
VTFSEQSIRHGTRTQSVKVELSASMPAAISCSRRRQLLDANDRREHAQRKHARERTPPNVESRESEIARTSPRMRDFIFGHAK